MKYTVWFAAILFIGLVIGGLGPRIDLRREKDKNRELESRLKDKPSRSSGLGEIQSILKIPDSSEAARQDKTDYSSGTNSDVTVKREFGRRPHRDWEDDDSDFRSDHDWGIEDGIEAAREIWEIRSEIAMKNFIASAELNEENAMQFKVLIEAMNIRIKDRIADFAAELQTHQNINPESGVRLVNDLTGILVMTYDEADRTLPDSWREDSGNTLDLADFINPSVAEPLIGVEDKLDAMSERRHERFEAYHGIEK